MNEHVQGAARWLTALGWLYAALTLLSASVIAYAILVTGSVGSNSGAFLTLVAAVGIGGWACLHTASQLKKGAGRSVAALLAVASLLFFPLGTLLGVGVIYHLGQIKA